jgi:N-acyl-D-amino-acid deacylase
VLEGGQTKIAERLNSPETWARIKTEIGAALSARGLRDLSFATVAFYRPDPARDGLTMAQVAERRFGEGSFESQLEAAREMLLEGGAQMVYHLMSDADVERIMRHPQVAIASDSSVLAPGDGIPHPRGYGDNARVLGTYVRERHVISLEDAIRKMTSLPAQHFGLANRGLVRVGYAADLVVFDPGRVADTATYEAPHAYADGIPFVIVNGVVVVRNGAQTSARPGQVLAHSILGSTR